MKSNKLIIIVLFSIIIINCILICVNLNKLKKNNTTEDVVVTKTEDTEEPSNEADEAVTQEFADTETAQPTEEFTEPVAEPVDNNAIALGNVSLEGIESVPSCFNIDDPDVQQKIVDFAVKANPHTVFVFFEFIDETCVKCKVNAGEEYTPFEFYAIMDDGNLVFNY